MTRTTSKILFGVFLLFLSFSWESIQASASLRSGAVREDSVAPDFTLSTIRDETVSLKDFKDKGIILFFFTTWCPYCREKMPELARHYSAYEKQGIELLVIDSGESKAKVVSFASKEDYPFDILLDTSAGVADAYGVLGVPTFVLISKEGKVVFFGNRLPDNYAARLQV